MPNSAYLCATAPGRIYPSQDDGFDPAEETLAHDVYAVPLLWLALFRERDLVSTEFHWEPDPDVTVGVWDAETGSWVEKPETEVEEPMDIPATAPVADRVSALAQLAAAVPVLERLFDTDLSAYATFLGDLVRHAPGDAVTIQWDEIEALYDDEEFLALVSAAWASLDTPGDETEDRARFIELATLRPTRWPAADALLTGADMSDDDHWNHARLLGVALARPVPWEPGVGSTV